MSRNIKPAANLNMHPDHEINDKIQQLKEEDGGTLSFKPWDYLDYDPRWSLTLDALRQATLLGNLSLFRVQEIINLRNKILNFTDFVLRKPLRLHGIRLENDDELIVTYSYGLYENGQVVIKYVEEAWNPQILLSSNQEWDKFREEFYKQAMSSHNREQFLNKNIIQTIDKLNVPDIASEIFDDRP